MDNRVTIVLLAFLIFGPASKSGAESVLQQIGEFAVPEANQGVGVDAQHFYAVDNQAIGKYDKTTGKLVKKWQGDKKGPFLHLDSAMVMDGKIYAAHSNYPDWPMTSSLEIFDAETMEHMGTRSFGIQWGALPFVNVMIGTFMLEALRGAADVQGSLARLKLDWPHAMVLVSSRAGSNVSSGLTEGTNWLVLFLKAVSGFSLPDDRIKIVPYAEVRPSLSQAQLVPADLAYYVQRVWGPLYYRKVVSDQVFAGIPTIYLPDRPPLPGDYVVTQAGAIDQFMIRMKHSLRDAREMLSNTVAFWMVRELANKNWDAGAVDIPGVTTGFPGGVAGYPAVTPQ